MAKISSRKTQKVANPQKYTPAKISCHTVDDSFHIFQFQFAIFVTSICDPIRLLLRIYRKAKGAGSEPFGFLVGHHNTNYVSFKIYKGEEQDLAKNNDNDDNNT